METVNNGQKTLVREVIGGVKVIESEYRVMNPVFVDTPIERPVYTEKKIEIPVGVNEMVIELARVMAQEVVAKVLDEIDSKLNAAIDKRIKEIEVPTIRYVETEKIVEVPKYQDVAVSRPVFVDKEIINPVLVDKTVVNPVIKDVEVVNAILKDRVVINPIWEDTVIQRPKYVDKEVTAIHIKYVDPKGNPE